MAGFNFGKKAREERELKAEEERKRAAAEEAERQRKVEDERKRAAAEEAERQRKAEEERKRKAAEEAERQRKAEEEHKRKAAEEEKRKKAEEARKLMKVYENFASHTAVDCNALATAGFVCVFDDMEYTAEIRPAQEYLDSSYRDRDGKYQEDDKGNKKISDYSTTIALDLKMIYDGSDCILYPRIKMRCRFGTSYGKTIEKIYIRIGENRYVAPLDNVSIFTRRSDYGSYETDHSVLPLGMSDIDILREIAQNKHPVKIRLGEGEGRMELTELDIAGVKEFLEACESAGVFAQPALKSAANEFSVITRFNEP